MWMILINPSKMKMGFLFLFYFFHSQCHLETSVLKIFPSSGHRLRNFNFRLQILGPSLFKVLQYLLQGERNKQELRVRGKWRMLESQTFGKDLE